MSGNQKEKFEYVADTFSASFIWISLYITFLFEPLENYGYIESVIWLYATDVIFTLIGLGLTIKKQRNSFSVFCIQVSSCFCYTIMANFLLMPEFFSKLIEVSVFIIVFLTGVLFLQKGKLKFKLKQGLLNIYRIVAFASVFSIIFVGVNTWKVNNKEKREAYVSEETIAKNIDVLQRLAEDEWKATVLDDKIKVLQIVADIETRYLGLSHRLNVQAESLEYRTLGEYSENNYKVAIDLEQLETYDSMKCVEVICHEAYHAYQFELVDLYYAADDNKKNLYIFRDIIKYENEFKNYIDGHEDFYAYYAQRCEENSRNYSEDAVCDYYKKIFGSEYHGYELDIDFLAELL